MQYDWTIRSYSSINKHRGITWLHVKQVIFDGIRLDLIQYFCDTKRWWPSYIIMEALFKIKWDYCNNKTEHWNTLMAARN